MLLNSTLVWCTSVCNKNINCHVFNWFYLNSTESWKYSNCQSRAATMFSNMWDFLIFPLNIWNLETCPELKWSTPVSVAICIWRERILKNIKWTFVWYKNIGIKGRKRSSGFLRIFTVAFLFYLTPAEGSNPAGHSFTLT